MSSPLVELPSRPERVAVGPTGFQPVPDNEPKKAKKRKREEEEAEKKDGASCSFLLWGSEDSESSKTWAVDVSITNDEHEDEIFKALKKRYHKELGLSRILHVFKRFKRLKPVTFRLICRDSKRFLAFVQPLDLDESHKRYSKTQEEVLKYIKSIAPSDIPDDPPYYCYRESSGEYYHVDSHCPNGGSDEPDVPACPFQELDWSRNQIQLEGLYVETAWCPIKSLVACLGILFSSVAIGRSFFWGSWEVIFGAGSFIIALLMLVLTILSRYDV
ncbi:hypothetical protein COCMIDRAFT_39991 [Bipolaris oryzae ATCC 44560]|uniref:Uncharacterized protein n=1 Tax=Bipolaris oryzae ATCC 44560 TaxID=930090 RepID=W6Z2N0_COCMI|nr:uncharacterized protein COCMIDRAFT_39991 [Bipolaris oryzae ATCC 44560]EUC41909.1 hypothetical protein COCMIDRAFT_39991 [Bipolaris oryzae ATCC 44560]